MAEPILMNSVHLPDVSYREVRRYMHSDNSDSVNSLIDRVCVDVLPILSPKVCFSVFDITFTECRVCSTDFVFESEKLVKSLKNSHKAVLFSATLGIALDRLIARYKVSEPAAAVCAHALGSERVEALCDEFCKIIRLQAESKGQCLTPRFSPGYGDFDIINQKLFCELLSLNKNLGICLSDSCLMTPSKSVTAVFGIRY